MRKYAILTNNVITSIQDLDAEQLQEVIKGNQLVVDITDILPFPAMGWILNGNQLEIPQNLSDREKFEIDLNDRKCKFGIELSKSAVNRIGARNKILNKSGTQVVALLTQLLSVKYLLETGALGTARNICVQLKSMYTEYADIFDYVIAEINAFEVNFGF